MVDRIVAANLVKDNIVAVHVCDLTEELLKMKKPKSKLIDEGITKEDLATRITDYLAKACKSSIKQKSQFILITIGGETSYRCSKAINCEYLQVVDSILPSIPLCMDSNAQLIVTKSGNLGTSSTLIDIVKYFEHHMNKKIAITTGDTLGIGEEITIKALNALNLPEDEILIIGKNINHTLNTAYETIEIDPNDNGKFCFESLKTASSLANEDKIKAIVTAPVSKEALHKSGCTNIQDKRKSCRNF